MKGKGFSVSAICSPGNTLEEFRDREGVVVHTVEMARRITPMRDLVSVLAIFRRLRQLQPAIVHAHTPKGGLLGMLASFGARSAVRIYHIHGLPYMTATGARRFLLQSTERIACGLADRVYCVSPSIQETAVRDKLVSAKKARTLRNGSINGIDAENKFNPAKVPDCEQAEIRQRYGLEEGRQVIGYLGRIVRDKGITELAEAWFGLRDKYPAADLLMVGPVEQENPVPLEIMDLLRADSRVYFTGPVLNPVPLYALMDLLVLPSYREGFGLAAIEAAAMEKPVVASRIPGCIDAVENGKTGLLVPARDASALRLAIATYLDDGNLREAHGKAGRQRVKKLFGQKEMWEALHAEYLQLLPRHKVMVAENG
jgi:glycosyltransferase involved in cell wall biosynthesis